MAESKSNSNGVAFYKQIQMATISNLMSKIALETEVWAVTTDEEKAPLESKLRSQTSCVVCGKSAKLYCSRCKFTSYCVKECQVKDWPIHKADCRCPNTIREWHEARLKDHEDAIGKKWYSHNKTRRYRFMKIAWGIPRNKDMSPLYYFLYGKKVLELGCGNMGLYSHFQLFARCNRKEPLDWIPTDRKKPQSVQEPFVNLDAMTAVQEIPHDVIVISWPEHPGKGWLLPVFNFLLKRGKLPLLVYIGEKKGGSSMEPITWNFIETHYTTVAHVSAARWPFIYDFVSIFRPNDYTAAASLVAKS